MIFRITRKLLKIEEINGGKLFQVISYKQSNSFLYSPWRDLMSAGGTKEKDPGLIFRSSVTKAAVPNIPLLAFLSTPPIIKMMRKMWEDFRFKKRKKISDLVPSFLLYSGGGWLSDDGRGWR